MAQKSALLLSHLRNIMKKKKLIILYSSVIAVMT